MKIYDCLKQAAEIQSELLYIKTENFRKFFREVIFLNCYNKSASNNEGSLFFYTDYRDGVFDIIVSDGKPGKDTILELYFSNTYNFIIDKILENFFGDKSETGAMRTSLFNSFLCAKYNLTNYDDVKRFYNLEELLSWNEDFIRAQLEEERNRFALANTNKALDSILSYEQKLNKQFDKVTARYEANKNLFLANKNG